MLRWTSLVASASLTSPAEALVVRATGKAIGANVAREFALIERGARPMGKGLVQAEDKRMALT